MIPSIPDQASSIRCHCIFFLPIYIKGWRCLYYCLQRLCAAELPCHFFCPQSVKERFLSASFPKASAKVQPFSETASNPAIIFQENMIFFEKTGKQCVWWNKNPCYRCNLREQKTGRPARVLRDYRFHKFTQITMALMELNPRSYKRKLSQEVTLGTTPLD